VRFDLYVSARLDMSVVSETVKAWKRRLAESPRVASEDRWGPLRRPAFERAIADGLLARRRVDGVHDEVTYVLTDAGRRTLAP
jgi:hypothetical protein